MNKILGPSPLLELLIIKYYFLSDSTILTIVQAFRIPKPKFKKTNLKDFR